MEFLLLLLIAAFPEVAIMGFIAVVILAAVIGLIMLIVNGIMELLK